MSIDFNDPTTWDQDLAPGDALSMGIWALNTLAHPDASTDTQFAAADFFTEGSTALMAQMRDEPQWVVEIVYNTDPQGKRVAEDDDSNRTLHGPFPSAEAAQKWMDEDYPDGDMDVRDMIASPLNVPSAITSD